MKQKRTACQHEGGTKPRVRHVTHTHAHILSHIHTLHHSQALGDADDHFRSVGEVDEGVLKPVCVCVSECEFTVTELLVHLSAQFGHVLLRESERLLQRQTLTVLRENNNKK